MAEGGKEDEVSPFSDPVFKRISLKNGEINKMSHSDLKKLARKVQISVEGTLDILRKRLKSHYRKKFLKDAEMKMPKKLYPYYIVIDFEATCEDRDLMTSNFQHEIIEFPAVVVNSETLAVENVFHEYVRPVLNTTLSKYCMSLTGISQDQVDSSDPFPSVLQRFEKWLHDFDLIGQSAIVTDGPYDMARFLLNQVKASNLPYPKFAKRWVNIKKTFANFYSKRKSSLDVMLSLLNIEFEGRRHSGIDDSLNIARILIELLKDGACIQVNERIDLSSFQCNSLIPVSQLVKPVKTDDFICQEKPLHLLTDGREIKKKNEYDGNADKELKEALHKDECSSSTKEVCSLPVEENIEILTSLHLNLEEREDAGVL